MPVDTFDYIREVNRLSETLLSGHAELLERKNIRRKRDLIRVFKLDLDKLTHALLEVQDNRSPAVLQTFFGDSVERSAISARLAGDRIYHIGFEIHEPLGLVLHGIQHWIEHSKRALGVKMRVKEFLRFPASPAFQKRVGAFTEIMRIWLEVSGRVLMLELFDIHRPADSFLANAPNPAHRNFTKLFTAAEAPRDRDTGLTRLFAGDEIWHYALYVKTPDDVKDLHRELQMLTGRDSSYSLPYTAPVHNPYDDSFHTKIVRTRPEGGRLELEFVTQFSDGRNQATCLAASASASTRSNLAG